MSIRVQNQDVEEEKSDHYAPADTGGNRSADTPPAKKKLSNLNLDYNRNDTARSSAASHHDVNRFVKQATATKMETAEKQNEAYV